MLPDDVMAWLIENDGVDFLTKGAESMGKQRLLGRKGSAEGLSPPRWARDEKATPHARALII